MVRHDWRGRLAPSLLSGMVALTLCVAAQAQPAPADPNPATVEAPGASAGEASSGGSILHRITSATERMEMTVNTSRILTLEQKIPQAQVNNRDVLELTPLSPNQVQIFAKKPGVTQVNLWGENNRLFTIDVVVFADARELEILLKSEFPSAAIRVRPIAQGVMVSGYVDHPQHIARIIQLSEEYYPKVINNLTVGGVQKVVLHTKVMEISRTKLRGCGMDWAGLCGNSLISSTATGLLATAAQGGVGGGSSTFATTGNTQTFMLDADGAFFGVLEAMRQNSTMQILSEPNLVAISGRPASFVVGGEIPVLVPQSLGTVVIEWKKWGTQIDFVPIVLGNGQIRLEVRPRVSEIDNANAVNLNGYRVPGLLVREAETGVEMKAGQTLALAGLVQSRTEATSKKVPWVGEVPYLGVFFGKVHEEINEVELLILVTPELIEALDPQEVPPCGPGTFTTSPNDVEFYLKGQIEVPVTCGPCAQPGCASCGPGCADNGSATPDATAQTPVRTARAQGRPDPSNRANRSGSGANGSAPGGNGPLPGFLGPVGYDMVQ